MTASLHIIKGTSPGERVPLDKDKIVLGRNPDCDVVIPVTSVSREHAHIVRVGGKFFVEDLESRNGTFVNNQQIDGRTPLKNADRIRICDFVAAYEEAPRKPLPAALQDDAEEEADDGGTPNVEATLAHDTGMLLLGAHPADKLRALLEISDNLSRTLELDRLLPRIADSLFQLFKQADRCFVILAEEGGKLLPKVTRTRREQAEETARFSRSIVRQCLDTRKLFLSNNADNDQRILSQSVVDFRIRSVMCAPLLAADGSAFGVIQLDTQDRSKKFGEDDLKLLLGVAQQASAALQNAKLYRDAHLRAQLESELQLAHEVQRGFLPRKMPEVPGYEFFAHYEPAQDVGGDYYGFVPLGPKRLALSLGDVAGKGVAAALLMAKLSSDVRYCLLSEPDLPRAVAALNDLVCQGAGQMQRFITLAAALLDTEEHTATLVNAGHMGPLLYRADAHTLQEAMPLSSSGFPMGIAEGQTFATHRLPLAPGDSLLFYSDGVTDADNLRNESFGLKGVREALKGVGDGGARALVERIVRAVKLHGTGKPTQKDDITLVCVGRVA